MVNYPRLILQIAATTGIAALLLTAAPAVAAESTSPALEAATATAKKTHPVAKKYASRRTRIAAWHHYRRVSPVYGNQDYCDVWCGQQIVLMIGVAY
jgi:hypothetical protein